MPTRPTRPRITQALLGLWNEMNRRRWSTRFFKCSKHIFGSTHPPPFSHVSCVCFFILSAFDTALISSVFQAVEMLTRTAQGALNVTRHFTDLATGQENVPPGIAHKALIAEPLSPQDIHTAPTDPLSEPTVNPVQSSDVFDDEIDEVADIAQVACDSELFESELSTSSPRVNVKENLRRTLIFGSVLEPLALSLTL